MTPPKTRNELPVRAFASSAEWEEWLQAQPRTSKGVWLKLAKSASSIASVSERGAIDGALCHGWIDGQRDKFDADYWLVRFTPRRPKGKWSQLNRARALVLIKLGRMRAAGSREIEQAKIDGRWKAAYSPQSKANVPRDLKSALERNPGAKRYFERLDSHNRYAILHRVETAKKPETRADRIEKYVTMLRRGETIYPSTIKASEVKNGSTTQRKNGADSRRQQGPGARSRRRARG
ncbi:MAG TPA: YdeI/OmpD-associated family protein [Candidatus Acidoferrum sp.]|nr:YdeI/OmpD-associated family protein [Candidatus Acidoferrum sp.]